MATLDRFQGLFSKKGKDADEPDLSKATDQEIADLAAARLAPDDSAGPGGRPPGGADATPQDPGTAKAGPDRGDAARGARSRARDKANAKPR